MDPRWALWLQLIQTWIALWGVIQDWFREPPSK